MKITTKIKLIALAALALPLALPAETIEAEHGLGRVKVPLNPQRVVVLDYGTLDTFEALGVSPKLAVPKTYMPSYLEKYKGAEYENIGNVKEFNLETINAFKPDLIVISARQIDFYPQLSAIAPVYYVSTQIAPDQLAETKKNILFFGKIFGKEEAANKAVKEMEEAVERAKIKAHEKNLRTLVLIANDGKISAFGSGSRFGLVHDALEVPLADAKIKVGLHGQLVNFEYIAMTNPDMILVVDRSAALGVHSKDVKVLENPLVARTKAAKNGRIVKLDPESWYLSGGGILSEMRKISEVEKALEK